MSQYIEGDWQRGIVKGLVIAHCDSQGEGAVYVEIGVRTCETIKDAAPYCREMHGVDVDSMCRLMMPASAKFWHMTSTEFFTKYDGSEANIVFIDADHSASAVERDFHNSLSILADDGMIVLHDTYPYRRGISGKFPGCGGAWLVASEIASDDSFQSFTIPRFPGVTIVSRV